MRDSSIDNAAPVSARPRWASVLAWSLCLASWAISLGLAFYFLHEDWATTSIGLTIFFIAVAIGWRLDRRIDLSFLHERPSQEPPSQSP